MSKAPPKVAIVHDWLVGGGAELVVEQLHKLYPEAPIYTSYTTREWRERLDGKVRTGWLQYLGPLRKFIPMLRIWWFKHIQSEIKKYYDRESTVIHPPVYLERFQKRENQKLKRNGFLIVGRQTPYKRFDLAIEACNQNEQLLTVVGDGPDHARLRKLAGHDITFLGKVSDAVTEQEFASAEALIFPGLDDFGITPVEAMASGTPVIAYKAGGALDYVLPGKSGEFFDQPTVESLAKVLKDFRPERYSHAAIAVFAQRFSREHFQEAMLRYIKGVM
jgi:glycosyltransferase involved in cell wall biosynthesis